MKPAPRPSRIHLRLSLLQAAVALGSALLAEAGAQGLGALLERLGFQPNPSLKWIALASVALLVGLLAGLWSTHGFTRRLGCLLETSRLWLRGSLSLRAADRGRDELGELAEGMDLLAGQLERDERDLAELRERNTRLADQVRLLAVIDERNRLARELHDGVKQQLFSLAITASAIRARLDSLQASPGSPPPDLVEMVRTIENSARLAQGDLTRLIEDLRPVSLQEQGLASALNNYSLLFGAREHLLVYVDVQGGDCQVPPSIAEALYRVAQESLHNIARHARATRVDILLRCRPEQVCLSIRDNGIGFDASLPRRGLGLSNMKERMLDVGGGLTVESRPGEGAVVLAEVLLPRQVTTPVEVDRSDKPYPAPSIQNWSWLGQRLVIPVGQTWPWHPADQAHLRRPVVEPGQTPLAVMQHTGWLGTRFSLSRGTDQPPIAQVRRTGLQFEWVIDGARWALQPASARGDGMILTRNTLPLAAAQSRGRLLETWIEIVYDDRGFRLCASKDVPGVSILSNEIGDVLLSIEQGGLIKVILRQAMPIPLLIMVAALALVEFEHGKKPG